MKLSAGTCIIFKNKILFCHPTNSSWISTFSPPKGGVDKGEKIIDAAIRETKEEVGISISKKQILNRDNPIEIIYYGKKEKIYKIVYLYIVKISSLEEIGLNNEIVPREQLQLEEIDFAKFLNIEEIEKLSFHRFTPLISLISKKTVNK